MIQFFNDRIVLADPFLINAERRTVKSAYFESYLILIIHAIVECSPTKDPRNYAITELQFHKSFH